MTQNKTKNMSCEIKKIGIFWRISLRGVLLKRTFWRYDDAEMYLAVVHNYFGDDCVLIVTKVA